MHDKLKPKGYTYNRNCKSRGCGTKDSCLTLGDPTHISFDMVEKGLGRESDEVIVGVITEGLKRSIVRIVIKRMVH